MQCFRAIIVTCIVAMLAACSDSSDSPAIFSPLLDRYTLSSTDSVPEGIAFDSRKRAFYASSLQGGSIVRIDASGQETLFRSADGRARLVGIKVDSDRHALWACAQQVDGLDNRVWLFDLRSTQLRMEFLLGALSTNGSCNDLTLDNSGAAYVTDPVNPFIYKLDPVTGEGSVFASDPLFTDVTGAGLGLNGITVTADGDALVVAKFIPASLLTVSLPDAASINSIALDGDALPSPDGLVMLGEDLFSVSDHSVNRVRFNSDRTTGTVVSVPQISGLSTATIADSSVYVIKSEVFNFVVGQPLDTPFEIFRLDTAAFEQ